MNNSEIPLSINATSSTSQPSTSDHKSQYEVDYEAIAELIPISILITLVNSLVLVLFAKSKPLRSPQNYVLFSLAVCDLMTGTVNIPLFIVVVFTPTVASPRALFYAFFLVGTLNSFTAISSCYHILVASTEKYLAIVRPVTHRRISKKKVLCVLSATWLISFTMAFIPFTWINMEDRRTGSNLNLAHVIFCLLAVFLLPYAFMIYVFVIIFKSISRKERRRRTSYAKSRRSGKQAAVEKKCLMLFVTMAIVFAMCWLPWFVLTLLYRLYYDVEHLETPSHVFVLVRYSTSIVNPLLYSFFRRDFRVALKSLFQNGRSTCLALFSGAKDEEPANYTTVV